MHRLSLSLLALVASIGILLLPLLLVPFIGVVAEDQKGPLVGLMLGITLAVGAVMVLFLRNALASRPSMVSLIGAPLLVTAVISALVNDTVPVVWFGEAMEWGTVASYGLFALALLAASLVPAGAGRRALYIYVCGALFAGVLSAIMSLGGNSGVLSNWPTIGVAVALALVCTAALADWSSKWGDREWMLALCSAVLFVCMLIFFSMVYVGTAAAVLLISAAARATLFSLGRASRLPILSLLLVLGLVVSVTLGLRNPVVPVPPDIRPSIEATHLVSAPSFATSPTRPIIGAGPESFGKIWNRYRPQEFNQTPLWNTTFKEGNSTVATIFVELGILGVLAWILPFIAVSVLYFRKAGSVSSVSVASLSVASGYYLLSFFYTTGLVPALLCAVLLGFVIRSLRRTPDATLRLRWPLRVVVAVLLVVPGIALITISSLQLISLHYRMIGIKHFEAGRYTAAHDSLSRGIQYWATPRLYANDANVLLAILREAAASSTPPVETINQPIQAANQAMSLDRNDLTVMLTRASVYIVLVSALRITDAQDNATSSITNAIDLAPNRPEGPYLRALLAAHLGRMDEARIYVGKVLDLKPNYEPALDLERRLSGQ